MPTSPRLVLASTSVFRRELLGRLQISFETASPDVDETALPGETPAGTAERLSADKARAVVERFPEAVIIGSDQVACLGAARFGKPYTRQRALEQLRAMSGQTVVFHTGLCVLNSATGRLQLTCVPTEVGFRTLADEEIERYLDKEQPYQCAGSAKSEGLGIALLSHVRADDPNALIGLPLIALCAMLRAEGFNVP